MELEELKKSWNALDEHLKDKEPIKEEELGKLIGHADKGIHAIARLNIKLILISLPVLVLFLLEVLLHGRLNPIYIIIILSWIPHYTGTSPPPVFYNRRKWTKCL